MLRCFLMLLAALCCVSVSLSAQTPVLDSLRCALAAASTDTAKISLLLRLAEESQGTPMTSQQYAEAAYTFAKHTGNTKRAAEALNWLSMSQNEQGRYNEARISAQKALSLAQRINDYRMIAMAYNQLGTSDWRQGNFDAALEVFFKALPMMENLRDSNGLAVTLNRIGNIYVGLQQHSHSREYYRQSLTIAQKTGDKRRQANQLSNIGNNYLQEHSYDSAVVYLLQAYQINKNIDNKRGTVYNLMNLGESYLHLQRLQEADATLAKALALAKEVGSKDFVVYILRVYTELKTAQHLFDEALHYGKQAIILADTLRLRLYKREVLQALSNVYAAADKPAEALRLYKDYIALRDSLVNDENTKRAAYRENKYAADKKDAEIKLLKKDAENQTLVRNALLGGLGLVGALVFVLLFSNTQRKKANALLQAQAAQIQLANTQLSEKNAEILVSRERLEVMSEVGRSLTASLAVETIITNLYQRVSEVMDATVFGIGVLRAEKGVIEYKLAMNKGERFPPYERDLHDTNQFPVWSIREQKPVFINDVDVEGTKYIPSFREKINVLGQEAADYAKSFDYAKSLLYVPLLLEGASIGVLSVQSYSRNAYSQGDLETLQTLANYAAIAIANAESAEEIIRQKAIVEEFNRNIRDSIRYAKRIQDAMLPSQEILNRLLPEHFIFFRPKDVVSGDFYWCKERDGFIFVAAVDCTGHGVPGAFMSLIGNAMLNELTERLPDPRPELILREMHYGLQRALKQRETGNEDGMDVCLCRIDLWQRRVLFAGAISPLYVVMGNDEVLEYRGTQEELGGSEERHPVYEAHEIDLSGVAVGGAMLYLTSDGYKDQFNQKRKKLTAKGVKEVIAGVCGLEMAAQREGFGAAMQRWMGSTKQMDDMLVLGVRV